MLPVLMFFAEINLQSMEKVPQSSAEDKRRQHPGRRHCDGAFKVFSDDIHAKFKTNNEHVQR